MKIVIPLSVHKKMLSVRDKHNKHTVVTPLQVEHTIEYGREVSNRNRILVREFEFEDEIIHVKYIDKETMFKVVDVYGISDIHN